MRCDPIVHLSRGVRETENIAAQMAQTFTGGECLALHGDLGAGKTQFVRGLLKGLGGDPRTVSSPTFVLLNIYTTGRIPLFHLDAYRIRGQEDFESIGFSELLEQKGIVVVEWASRILSLLPSPRLEVILTPGSKNHRQIRIGQNSPTTGEL